MKTNDLVDETDELIQFLADTSTDPYAFALGAFDWDCPELRGHELEPWQVWVLTSVRDGLLDLSEAIQIAVTSGHGIGKSALVAILVLWAISTCEDCRGVVTANTENQLKTKTWVEVAKWYRLFIGKHLFKLTATALFSVDPEHEKTWRIDMVPWSEKNTEAFAGLHNAGKRVFIVFDEASAIDDVIHEVTEGALTDEDTEIIWLMFGNPTRNKGRFRDAHHGGRFAHRWRTKAVDSREVSFTNKRQIEKWIQDYGLDSDFVRVRVLGKFPRVDAVSFISLESVIEAVARPISRSAYQYVLGVDVGRFGDDPSVIYPRTGRDARSVLPTVLHGLDGIAVARRAAAIFHELRAGLILVDEGGVGASVVDHLRLMRLPVVAVQFGGKPRDMSSYDAEASYANMRAAIWGAMRAWISPSGGGAIPENIPGLDLPFAEELTGPTYGFNARDEIQLEKKSDMKKRGVPSPNIADALALTFAEDMPELRATIHEQTLASAIAAGKDDQRYADFNPFEIEAQNHG